MVSPLSRLSDALDHAGGADRPEMQAYRLGQGLKQTRPAPKGASPFFSPPPDDFLHVAVFGVWRVSEVFCGVGWWFGPLWSFLLLWCGSSGRMRGLVVLVEVAGVWCFAEAGLFGLDVPVFVYPCGGPGEDIAALFAGPLFGVRFWWCKFFGVVGVLFWFRHLVVLVLARWAVVIFANDCGVFVVVIVLVVYRTYGCFGIGGVSLVFWFLRCVLPLSVISVCPPG